MELPEKLVKLCCNHQYGAVRHQLEEMFKNWITAKFDVNTPDAKGMTLMEHAVQTDDVKMAYILKEYGVDIERKNKNDKTALMQAIEHAKPNVALWLIKQGADVNTPDYFGTTPLMALCDLEPGHFHHVGEKTMRDVLRTLLDKKAVINSVDERRETALMKACWRKNVLAAEYLVEAKADLNVHNIDGLTALDIACKIKDEETARFLIDAGTFLNLTNREDKAMQLARNAKMRLVVHALKARKEDIRKERRNARPGSHLTPYHRAAQKKNLRSYD